MPYKISSDCAGPGEQSIVQYIMNTNSQLVRPGNPEGQTGGPIIASAGTSQGFSSSH